MNNYGYMLKKLRKEKGWTQAELADKLNLGKSVIGMYENGKRNPTFNVIQNSAKLFCVSTDYIMTGYTDEESAKRLEEMIDFSDHIDEELMKEIRLMDDEKMMQLITYAKFLNS